MEDEDTEEEQHEQALEREEKEHGDFFWTAVNNR